MDLIMRNNIATINFGDALAASTPTAFEWSESDERTVLVVKNSSTTVDATLTVMAGNGLQGVNDLVLTVPKNSVSLVKLDSGRFKNVSGTNKGKIVLSSTTAINVAVVAMV